MEKINVGIIGLGGIAQVVHLPLISKMTNINLHSVAELDKRRLSAIAENYNIKNTFTDYTHMLKDKDLNALIITTPTNTHCQIALDALNAGKNILVEKPVARNYEEAKNIKEAAIKNEKIAMVGMNARFRPDSMLLKSLLKSGELGEIFYIKATWMRKQSSDQKWFLRRSDAGGGVVLDLGISLLDLALWLYDFTPVKGISVQNFYHTTSSVEDSSIGLIKFKDNKIFSYDVSWSIHSERSSFALAVYGTKGTAYLNPFKVFRKIGGSNLDISPANAASTKNLFKKSYENELKHFFGAIEDPENLISSIDDSLDRMKLIEGIYKSANLEQEIVFNGS
ncbi:MAG: Gfo/Idh/MocA family oxidoreductase [Melioribacteraceae bacterium]|nr:Gfo/Idh/MocA family oxidoreductase [Melioribacteraceae bacterium]MCO6472196.1 Gfo/Idh/MocA family oxidoreductase [Melioribacteraceae bacterium]MDD3557438.1 Gfo/Idh/MocA family oxidoreductase [Melioribacteraceae bacterium]